MDGAAFKDCTACSRPGPHRERTIRYDSPFLRGVSVVRDRLIGGPFLSSDGRQVSVAQPRRGLNERVEDGLQIERRAANDLEYVGGGSFALIRFRQRTS
jgi:hypothetical protein